MEWISVKDGLPDKERYYAIKYDTFIAGRAWFGYGRFHYNELPPYLDIFNGKLFWLDENPQTKQHETGNS